MLASFLGVLPILTPPLCALAFIMCSKSNPLVVFALDLMSAYEGEHTIFGLLGQANLTQNLHLYFLMCIKNLWKIYKKQTTFITLMDEWVCVDEGRRVDGNITVCFVYNFFKYMNV
jgi:hypothetical protein